MYKMFRNFLAIVTLLVLTGCGNWPHQKNSSDAKPLKVLVVGGGPAGLVSALEANHAGANVSVIEKRSNYTRQQHIILDEHSLNTLNRFDIDCPELSYFKPAKVGVVPINKLEEALKKKAESQGIRILSATMTEINKNHSITVSDQNQLRSEIAYDILIGADGGRSKVRSDLGIEMNSFGNQAWGAGAVVKLPHPKGFSLDTFHVQDSYTQAPLSVRRFISPDGYSVVFSHSHRNLNRKEFCDALASVGFNEEADMIESGKEVGYYDNVSIKLVQAKQFSNAKASAIIIGDAAASASFFEGKGANTAIATAVISGDYVRNRISGRSDAEEQFQKKMTARTNEMIQASKYLFDR